MADHLAAGQAGEAAQCPDHQDRQRCLRQAVQSEQRRRAGGPSHPESQSDGADTSFGKFGINLNKDGKLYIAVHSGHGFFDIGKGRETPEQLRRRFTGELKWFTDMIDVFRPM